MKKFVSVLMVMFFTFSILGVKVSAKERDYDKLEKKIEKTNQQINLEIQKAIDEANKLVLKYQQDMAKYNKDVKPQYITEYLGKFSSTLDIISKTNTDSKDISQKLSDLYNNIEGIKNYVELKTDIVAFSKKSNQEKMDKITEKFNKDLDRIINRLIQVTNRMAEKLIQEGRKYGIEIYSEWIEVEIGGRIVLVDPCRSRSI